MYYKEETSIPRIPVERVNGKVVCVLDGKLQQRFGPVLYKNKKQGRHLFSISYCINSMAVKYTLMPEREIVSDIISRFHCDFLTILTLNSNYIATDTSFLRNWEHNYDTLAHEYQEMRLRQHEELDITSLENYLNVVGAMMHTLPCNVAYSDNASDSKGGALARKAIGNINKIANWQFSPNAVNANISEIIDHGVVDEFFGKGFNKENISLLAFLIMQILELQSLQRTRRSSHLYLGLEKDKIENDLFEIVFKYNNRIPRDGALSHAISQAINLIGIIKKQVRFQLMAGNHRSIKGIIAKGMDQSYNFIYT